MGAGSVSWLGAGGGSQWKTQDVETEYKETQFKDRNSSAHAPRSCKERGRQGVCGQQKSWRNSSFRGNVFNSTLFLLIFLIFHLYMCAEYMCIYMHVLHVCMHICM